jgi:transcriptional regulator with XRE-family HTH domain
MTGSELRAIRRSLGLTAREMAAALGDQGNHNTRSVNQRQLERGFKPITTAKARLAWYMARYGVPEEWLNGSDD